jgi:hypothetical protein
MSIFDLLFVGWFLGTVGNSLWIVGLLLRGRWTAARRHSIRLGIIAGLYLFVVFLTGRFSTPRVLVSDEILRYDDWCLGAQKATFADALGETHPETGMRFLVVTLKVISTAGRPQAAPKGALAYVLDDANTRYDLSERAQAAFEQINGAQPELTTRLGPHGSFLSARVFQVPRAGKAFFLGHRHGTGASFPEMFIIGTGFRRPPVIRLQIALDR